MQTALVEFHGSSAYIPEGTPTNLFDAIQQLLCVELTAGYPKNAESMALCFVWDGDGQPGLALAGYPAAEALSALRAVIADTVGFWDDIDTQIQCWRWLGSGKASNFRPIGSLTVRECVEVKDGP